MTLSDTQRTILAAAAQHEARLATAPVGLPTAARNAVFRSMLKHGLLAEVPAPAEYVALGWRQDDAGAWIAPQITGAGLQAIGEAAADGSSGPLTETIPALPGSESPAAATPSPAGDSGEAVAAPGAPCTGQHGASARLSLHDAARAVLAAWDANDGVALAPAVATLRAALPSRAKALRTGSRRPRQGTKQEAVLALLRRPEGATVAQIAEATGWANHTVRGFFAGLKTRGLTVEVLEEGYAIRAADMPGADDLMMRIYAAKAQKERELISERTRAALVAAKARGKALGGDRGYRPAAGPDAAAAALARREAAEQTAHRRALEVERLQAEGVTGQAAMARALTERGVPTPRQGKAWTRTTVARLLARVEAQAGAQPSV